MGRLLRQLCRVLAWAYPVGLLIATAVLRYVPLWQVQLAVYAPRVLFAMPLPFLTAGLLWCGRARELWTQLLAAGLVLIPLLGFELPGRSAQVRNPGLALRILSYNGNFAYGGQDALESQVRAAGPDIVVFQQLFSTDRLGPSLARSYRAQRTDGEFFIASRFPILETRLPARIDHGDRNRSPRYIRYVLDTGHGPLVLYNVHPISPSYQLHLARGGGLRQALRTGALFSLQARPDILADSELRNLQVQAFTREARRETGPVIIAGDTNLPSLSAALESFAGFQDGFEAVGSGFGYTFPSTRPWMRIDRIFASRHFRFLQFAVGDSQASDHRAVYATLEPTAAD